MTITPPESSASERRHWLSTLDDPDLARWLLQRVAAARALIPMVSDIAELAGAPALEVAASPFGMFAVTDACNDGVTHTHLEWRLPVAWPDDWSTPDSVAYGDHDVWEAGILHIGKYQSFLIDEPLTVYNPNHMAKWTSHEMLHRVCRFFWREDASRWEHYLGARLNELVPVALWYGLDEVLRGDDGGFDRAAAAARPWAADDAMQWTTLSDEALLARCHRAVRHVRWSLTHFEREWHAVQTELQTGARVPAPADGLDASSDALAYVVAHGPRLQSTTWRRLINGLLTDGVHYHSTVHAYALHIEGCFDRLLFGVPSLDMAQATARRRARLLWDVAQRAGQGGWDRFRPVMPRLREVRPLFDALWSGSPAPSSVAHDAQFSVAFHGLLGAAGLPFDYTVRGDTTVSSPDASDRLVDGLTSLAPRTLERLQRNDHWQKLETSLLAGAGQDGRRPLGWRLVSRIHDPVLRSLFELESLIAACTVADDDIEHLCASPDQLIELDWDELALIANRTVRFLPVTLDVEVLLREPELESPPPHATRLLAVAHFQGAASVVSLTPPIHELWQKLEAAGAVSMADAIQWLDESSFVPFDDQADLPETSEDWLGAMVEAGVFGVRGMLG